ncbi:MAG: hypothetical protein F4Y82_06455 [Cenarchaeum sp. SB0665_bin_23]|nr:hypothetical protein [Cenarchaeum sp. SB0664_bin_35]MXY61732.1 hypothetical protein [Cenarchaeum sp. SB0665_bin_23]MYG33624.1 hypothetical protein [Cenarchaeum sp. SB0677_bin_16]MYI52257.1 hypothetical protein [Cenarchaeum sp. SB0673_bin_9]MYJ28125.1 hypothetical protein [Cenarchaeum sp. SB0672_bin_9]
MVVLEALVIATIVLVGAWVGYAYWDDYTHNYDDYDAKAHHNTDYAVLPISYNTLQPIDMPVSWH